MRIFDKGDTKFLLLEGTNTGDEIINEEISLLFNFYKSKNKDDVNIEDNSIRMVFNENIPMSVMGYNFYYTLNELISRLNKNKKYEPPMNASFAFYDDFTDNEIENIVTIYMLLTDKFYSAHNIETVECNIYKHYSIDKFFTKKIDTKIKDKKSKKKNKNKKNKKKGKK